MKSTGIIRRIDELGRLVLPIELRRNFGWAERDPIEILTDGERVILQKYEAGCCFCNSAGDLKEFHGKYICPACLEQISALR